MANIIPQTLTKAYLITILLIATLVAPLPYSIITLILLAAQLYSTYKPLQAEIKLTLTIATLILTPLALETSTGTILSAILIVPILYLLKQELRENAQNQPLKYTKKSRKPTATLKSLITTLLLLTITASILLNQTLMLTTLTLTIYITIIAAYSLYKIPKTPLETSHKLIRIIVGETEKTIVHIKGKNSIPINIAFKSTHAWIKIEPTELTLPSQEETKINLTLTPPLAGPSQLEINITASDPWGLIQTNQTIEPVELHIIPKAKYAQWLAKKYLEQTAPGTSTIAEMPPLRAIRSAKQGIEFYGTRNYEPGDKIKDIDWKHVSKFQELIVKQYIGAHGQTTLIAANLDANDPTEADKTAYNIVITALTLATESIPTALAIYNQTHIITVTKPSNPRETLKKTLQLTQNITINKQPEKTLQPTQPQQLKHTINQLEQTKANQKLAQLLTIEYQATQETAKTHPATQAIETAIQNIPPPATITITTSPTHDADALNITLQKLKHKRYNIIQIEKSPTPKNSHHQKTSNR